MPIPNDTSPVAQCLVQRLSQRDADILHGVVIVDMQVPGGPDLQVEESVARDVVQHMIEETDPRGDVPFTLPVNFQHEIDLGFRCLTMNLRIASLHYGRSFPFENLATTAEACA